MGEIKADSERELILETGNLNFDAHVKSQISRRERSGNILILFMLSLRTLRLARDKGVLKRPSNLKLLTVVFAL